MGGKGGLPARERGGNLRGAGGVAIIVMHLI